MTKKTKTLLFEIYLIIIIVLCQSIIGSTADLPMFLKEGNYAQYEQQFSAGGNYQLFWNITLMNSTMVMIDIKSHGIQRNTSSGEFEVIPGGGCMVIDKENWEIIQMLTAEGSLNQSIGKKVPFWIPTNINQSSFIDTLYDRHIPPSKSERIYLKALSTSRECWVTENIYSAENSMTRWYDKETGIVLKIETKMSYATQEITILEILNNTNIEPLLINNQKGYIPEINGIVLVTALLVLSILIRKSKIKRN